MRIFFGVVYHLVYCIHALKTFKCDKAKNLLAHPGVAAPRNATHQTGELARSRLSRINICPPLAQLSEGNYTYLRHKKMLYGL